MVKKGKAYQSHARHARAQSPFTDSLASHILLLSWVSKLLGSLCFPHLFIKMLPVRKLKACLLAVINGRVSVLS